MWPKNWFERPTLAVVGAAMLLAGLVLGLRLPSVGTSLVLWGSGLLLAVATNYLPDDWQSGGFTVSALLLALAFFSSIVSML
ncbi:MAG: hypothetical protein GX600_11030 [Dehalococcoidia bacterium]|jgi:hypothetical protein|nr:hypothetical protein [Dehalococcoidia bacterium]